MALRQTYLSLKDKLPADAEVVFVMRGRGNDELAPSKQLLDEFNTLKKDYTPNSGFDSAIHYAWTKSNFAERFLAQIRGSKVSMARLERLAEAARSHDVFLVCYEGYDKPCHRKLLLQVAREDLGAKVDAAPFVPALKTCKPAFESLFD